MKNLLLVLVLAMSSLFASSLTDTYQTKYQMNDGQKNMYKKSTTSVSALLYDADKSKYMYKKQAKKQETVKCGSVKIETH
ncbi:hypothetical protein MNB_SM-4-385 [hydrothermal vent metagenome]|uniref:Uncharacterized protein n=1 Tax=hydrothermal vent metagenome TaxID=652676 RepID=A0A1W1BJH2_9ZZZZ